MNKFKPTTSECIYFGFSSESRPVPTDGFQLIELNTGKSFLADGINWSNVDSSRLIYLPKKNVNLNSLNNDVAIWNSSDKLPSKYRIENLFAYNVSANVGAQAKIALYSGPLGTGVSYVASVGINTNADEVHEFNIKVDGKKYLSSPAIYLRNTDAFGSTLTASFMLTVIDLS